MIEIPRFPELNERRIKAGLSIGRLCAAAGIDPSTWWRWSEGSAPLLRNYLAIVDALERLEGEVRTSQCADCGYPLGDRPVFLGGVWFCAACNPAISLDRASE
jgi:hypothetical protein